MFPSSGLFFFFQAEDGIRDKLVTGVQTCALPIFLDEAGLEAAMEEQRKRARASWKGGAKETANPAYTKLAERSEEHTSELQSLAYLVCRLLLEKKKNIDTTK